MVVAITTPCNDGIDNDGDGNIDYPDDSGCEEEIDYDENIVLGYSHACFKRGQTLMNVFGEVTYECKGTSCTTCVSVTEAGNYSTLDTRCYGLLACEFTGAGGGFVADLDPPDLFIEGPIDGAVYSDRRVLFDLSSDETVTLFYLDNINGRGRWKRIAANVDEISKMLRFKDGLNDITIKAIDRGDQETEIDITFRVDSKKPRIRRSYPKKGFANGDFTVEIVEENPTELVLYYGDCDGVGCVGMREEVLDETDIEEYCMNNGRGKHTCDISVDLDDYDEKEIQYRFELTDIAENVAISKRPIFLDVDISDPIVLNPDSFWEQGVGRYNRYIYFDIEIDEPNFDELSYTYVDYRGRTREKRLCSRLKEGRCTVKKSFRKGDQVLDVQVVDEAGNMASVGRVEFTVE
jgi:hypothetical protein